MLERVSRQFHKNIEFNILSNFLLDKQQCISTFRRIIMEGKIVAFMNKSLRASSQSAPASSFSAVIPSDVADLPKGVTRAIFVGEAGIVAVRDSDGNTVEILSGASQYHPLRVVRVMASATTAGRIIALY